MDTEPSETEENTQDFGRGLWKGSGLRNLVNVQLGDLVGSQLGCFGCFPEYWVSDPLRYCIRAESCGSYALWCQEQKIKTSHLSHPPPEQIRAVLHQEGENQNVIPSEVWNTLKITADWWYKTAKQPIQVCFPRYMDQYPSVLPTFQLFNQGLIGRRLNAWRVAKRFRRQEDSVWGYPPSNMATDTPPFIVDLSIKKHVLQDFLLPSLITGG